MNKNIKTESSMFSADNVQAGYSGYKKQVSWNLKENCLEESWLTLKDGFATEVTSLPLAQKNSQLICENYGLYLEANDNFVIPGVNDDKQVLFGSYRSEAGEKDEKVFWTEKAFQCSLKPIGDETSLEVVFGAGKRAEREQDYLVRFFVIDAINRSIVCEHSSEYTQQQIHTVSIALPDISSISQLLLTIKSDEFSPKELGISEDSRKLGIMIKKISLKKENIDR